MAKKVLVTGSTKGIGKAVAERFHNQGWNVCLNGRNPLRVNELTTNLNQLREHSAIGIDSDFESVQKNEVVRDFISKEWGSLDCIIFNIGSGSGTKGLDSTFEENLALLSINFMNTIKSFNSLYSLLVKSDHASIFIIGSIAQEVNVNAPITYSYSKRALNMFGKAQALKLAKHKISINIINPGHILTLDGVWDRKQKESSQMFDNFVAENIPVGRIGQVSDIAGTIFSLANEKSGNFLTGTNLNLDGGTSLKY
jgi:NAD(P)-dependent dehydrogenase (short-subunit alcohol dehydrogenase family)